MYNFNIQTFVVFNYECLSTYTMDIYIASTPVYMLMMTLKSIDIATEDRCTYHPWFIQKLKIYKTAHMIFALSAH